MPATLFSIPAVRLLAACFVSACMWSALVFAIAP